jgi:hypothetical protein
MKTTIILLALILVVAFTGVSKASTGVSKASDLNLIVFYIPASLNQAYGFPVKIWDGKVMIAPNTPALGTRSKK